MSTAKQTNTNSILQVHVTNAFLLGWSISELLGRYRKGIRPLKKALPEPQLDSSDAHPPSKETSPRLDVSDGNVEKASDAFQFTALRIAQIYQSFGFESSDKASPLTKQIYELPQCINDWLLGKTKSFYTQAELRELLNDWSLQVWARLNAESPEIARALTAGSSLADTYWYLRLPRQRPQGLHGDEIRQEDWRRLLSKFRLDVERSRLQDLRDHLPPYVAAVIRNHLNSWAIGTNLVYQGGKLVFRADAKKAATITSQEEVALLRALARQMKFWDTMFFGSREATTFLLTNDKRQIGLIRRVGLFFILLGTALSLVGLSVVAGLLLQASPVPTLLQLLTNTNLKVSEWLGIVSFLWTTLIAVPVPLFLRAVYQATRDSQLRLDYWLTTHYITKRTLVPWNQYLEK